MLISARKHKLIGQVHFSVTGLSLERLLNIAFLNDISLYEVKRLEYTKISAYVPALQYKKLKALLPEGKYEIKRHSISGGARVTYALKKRYALLAGLLLGIVLLFAASQRVWTYNVKGTENVSQAIILEKLNSYQLLDWKGNLGERLENAEQQLLKDVPELSWASLTVRGVVLHAYIKERPPVTAAMPKDIPADIIATKSGVVENVTVLQGVAAVKKGQTIAKGQTLISGQLIFNEVPFKYISAQGTVTAKVWYFETMEVPLSITTSVRTGRKCMVRTMNFLGNNIVLSGKNEFADSEYEERQAPILKIGLPMVITERTYYELEQKTEPVSEAEAVKEAERQILDKIQSEVENEAVFNDRNTTYENLENGNLKVTMYIETIEKIGIYKEIK